MIGHCHLAKLTARPTDAGPGSLIVERGTPLAPTYDDEAGCHTLTVAAFAVSVDREVGTKRRWVQLAL